MSVSGLCEVCESNEVVASCDRCGTMVCEHHRDDATGLCASCARQRGEPADGPGEDFDDRIHR